MENLLDQKNARIKNLIIDLLYVICLLMLGYICFKLFGWMLVNFNKQYRSDIPAYIMILEDRPGTKLRLIYVVFRTLLGLAGGSELGVNIFLALDIILIVLCNHWYIHYYSKCDTGQPWIRAAVAFLSIAVIFAGPIYVPDIHPYFYKNTFPTFAWQSPTQHLLTLFSIAATLCLFKMMDSYKEKVSIPWWIASAVFFFLSAYSKPSYIIDIAPAIVIVFIIELFTDKELSFASRFGRLFVMGSSLIPAGLYIIMLYAHIYSGESESEVVVALNNSSDNPHILVALVCCMLFPFIVLLFNVKRIIHDRKLLMVVLIAVMGLLQMVLLSESGWRAEHGNFSWGSMIGGYMLMLTSVSVFMDNTVDRDFLSNKKALKGLYYLLGCGSLAMHLISNTYYFITLYHGAGFWR